MSSTVNLWVNSHLSFLTLIKWTLYVSWHDQSRLFWFWLITVAANFCTKLAIFITRISKEFPGARNVWSMSTCRQFVFRQHRGLSSPFYFLVKGVTDCTRSAYAGPTVENWNPEFPVNFLLSFFADSQTVWWKIKTKLLGDYYLYSQKLSLQWQRIVSVL